MLLISFSSDIIWTISSDGERAEVGPNVVVTREWLNHLIILLQHSHECTRERGDDATSPVVNAYDGVLKAATRVLSSLTARTLVQFCEIRSDKELSPQQVLKFFLAPIGMVDCAVDFLSMTLEYLQPILPRDSSPKKDSIHQQLFDFICSDLFLPKLESSPAVRVTLKNFAWCSAEVLVPKQVRCLLNILSSLPASNAPSDRDTLVTNLVDSLTSSVELNWVGQTISSSNSVIELIVDTLVSPADGANGQATSVSSVNKEIEELCSRLGLSLRRKLLKNRFNLLLDSVGRAMFRHPSSTAPLSLFGAIVGENHNYDGYAQKEFAHSIVKAAITLISLSVEELDVAGTGCKEIQQGADNEVDTLPSSQSDIFRRLAPLLLLRRTPPNVFRIAYKESRNFEIEQQLLHDLLLRLADHLVIRLDIGAKANSASTGSDVNFSSEERRMAAEIAGLCLPFYTEIQSDLVSCFDAICVPAFTDVITVLRSLDPETTQCKIASFSPKSIEIIRSARAALYSVVCHFAPSLDLDSENQVGRAIICTAEFCLSFLNTDQKAFDRTELEQDVIQLQAGCIEFFAVCIENLLGSQDRLMRAFCPEQGWALRDAQKLEGLERILRHILEILETGKDSYHPWSEIVSLTLPTTGVAAKNEMLQLVFPDGGDESFNHRFFSIPCRTCLWNALIVVSQRCNEEKGHLQLYAQNVIPWIIRWLADDGESSMDSDVIHPLCLTAAFQLCFILVTKTKSFGIERAKKDSNEASRSSLLLFRWATASMKRNVSATESVGPLTLAAIKLMLAIISVDQLQDGKIMNCLAPDELRDAMKMLQRIVDQDADPTLRALASQAIQATMEVSG